MHLDIAAGELRHAPVGREVDVDLLFLAGLQADQGGFDRREHVCRNRAGGTALDTFGRHAFVAHLRPGFDLDGVAVLRGALDRIPGAALQAQVLDHRVDVGVGDVGGVADNVELGDVDVAEIRHHFEGSDVGQLIAFRAGRLDARVAGDLQRMLAHGVAEAFAQQAVQDLGAHLLAEALLDHLGRHLAGAEALDLGATRDFAQATADHGSPGGPPGG